LFTIRLRSVRDALAGVALALCGFGVALDLRQRGVAAWRRVGGVRTKGSIMKNGSFFIPREQIFPFFNPIEMNSQEGLYLCWETDPTCCRRSSRCLSRSPRPAAGRGGFQP
jgi:hypothetical protein